MKNEPQREVIDRLLKENKTLMMKAVKWRNRYTNLAMWICFSMAINIDFILIILL